MGPLRQSRLLFSRSTAPVRLTPGTRGSVAMRAHATGWLAARWGPSVSLAQPLSRAQAFCSLERGARMSARSPQRIPPSSAMTAHCRVGPSCLSLWRVRLRCVADKSAPSSVASTAPRIRLNGVRSWRSVPVELGAPLPKARPPISDRIDRAGYA